MQIKKEIGQSMVVNDKLIETKAGQLNVESKLTEVSQIY